MKSSLFGHERLAYFSAVRHSDDTFGTWLYEQTGDPKIVQRLMRHASFHTSMLYVHDRRDLGGVVDALPRLLDTRHLWAV